MASKLSTDERLKLLENNLALLFTTLPTLFAADTPHATLARRMQDAYLRNLGNARSVAEGRA